MAGLLAAMRWAPRASWLVSACDLPGLRLEALEWLLSTRAPGVWATLPRLPGRQGVEPLLAHYDFRALGPLEALAAQGRYSPSLLADHPKVASPGPPADLAPAWENVNTPDDLARMTQKARRPDGPEES
jgi:molybdopterin-guanine dinucleotide biosynthesis protein A